MNHKKITKVLLSEKTKIEKTVIDVLEENIYHGNKSKLNPLHEELSYFKVLNNLNINTYSVEVFENYQD